MSGNGDRKVIDAALRKALASAAGGAGSCPDSNEMAAYLENRLLEAERSGIEEHASACASCQELLAMAVVLEGEEASAREPVAASTARASRRTLFRLSIPLPALAVVLAAVGLSVFLLRDAARRPDVSGQSARLADRESPKPTAAPAPTPVKAPEPFVAHDSKERRAAAPQEPRKIKVDAAASGRSRPPAEPADKREQAAALSDSAESKMSAPQALPVAAQAPPPPPASQVQSATVELDQARGPRQAQVRQLHLRQEGEGLSAGAAGGVLGGVVPTQVRPLSPREAVAALAARRASETAAKSNAAEAAAERDSRARPAAAAPPPIAARSVSEKAKDEAASERKVGGKTFVAFGGYWIDRDCLAYPTAEIVELEPSSTEAQEIRRILALFGRSDEASSNKIPTLIRYNDRTYLVR